MLFGAKTSLLGSFYGSGGIVAVVMCMWVMGVLCRKMDGMLSQESPLPVKATAVSWMSMLWMLWGSHDSWGLTVIGSLAIPAVCMWLLALKTPKNEVEVL